MRFPSLWRDEPTIPKRSWAGPDPLGQFQHGRERKTEGHPFRGNRARRRAQTPRTRTQTHINIVLYSSYRNSSSIYPQELAKSFWGRGRETVPRKCPWPPHPHAPFKTSCKEAQQAQGCPAFGDLGPGLGGLVKAGRTWGVVWGAGVGEMCKRLPQNFLKFYPVPQGGPEPSSVPQTGFSSPQWFLCAPNSAIGQ